jgi:hypothetical protein
MRVDEQCQNTERKRVAGTELTVKWDSVSAIFSDWLGWCEQ